MITELILSGLFGVADGLLNLLPGFEWTVNTAPWEYMKSFVSMIAYLLPWNDISQIAVLIIGLSLFRIAIAVIRSILGFIPFLG